MNDDTFTLVVTITNTKNTLVAKIVKRCIRDDVSDMSLLIRNLQRTILFMFVYIYVYKDIIPHDESASCI